MYNTISIWLFNSPKTIIIGLEHQTACKSSRRVHIWRTYHHILCLISDTLKDRMGGVEIYIRKFLSPCLVYFNLILTRNFARPLSKVIEWNHFFLSSWGMGKLYFWLQMWFASNVPKMNILLLAVFHVISILCFFFLNQPTRSLKILERPQSFPQY